MMSSSHCFRVSDDICFYIRCIGRFSLVSVILIECEYPTIVLYGFVYRESFREIMFMWEKEGESLEREEEVFFEEVERLQGE